MKRNQRASKVLRCCGTGLLINRSYTISIYDFWIKTNTCPVKILSSVVRLVKEQQPFAPQFQLWEQFHRKYSTQGTNLCFWSRCGHKLGAFQPRETLINTETRHPTEQWPGPASPSVTNSRFQRCTFFCSDSADGATGLEEKDWNPVQNFLLLLTHVGYQCSRKRGERCVVPFIHMAIIVQKIRIIITRIED